MTKAEQARARIAANPFYVLELAPDCARAEVEREGQKLLAMLELRIASASSYTTPLGAHTRTPELVRNAMAELRDPNKRLRHEMWSRLSADAGSDRVRDDAAEAADHAGPWRNAMVAMGWRSR